jgi:ribonuclease HI
MCEKHEIEFVWVKGHAGQKENERCDWLSYRALEQADLPADEGYEQRPATEGKHLKITQEGQPCRKCSTPVVKRVPRRRQKTGRVYFEYYLYCPNCQTMYMVEEAKRTSEEDLRLF